MDKLADKRVGIIGTGATSVQCVPYLARACKELYVFQRTPSSVDVRANAPIDPDWFSEHRHAGLAAALAGEFHREPGRRQRGGRSGPGRLDRSVAAHPRKIKNLPRDQRTPPNMLAAFEDSDFEKMEEIRARVDAIVGDRETAAKLKAWYRQLCKRPCFHDAYLQAFNTPGTHLVDTDGKGVERITENGFVVAGKEYEVDCIIYASGFEVGTEYKRRAGFDLAGRDGMKLSEHWARACAPSTASTCTVFPTPSSCSRPRAPI